MERISECMLWCLYCRPLRGTLEGTGGTPSGRSPTIPTPQSPRDPSPCGGNWQKKVGDVVDKILKILLDDCYFKHTGTIIGLCILLVFSAFCGMLLLLNHYIAKCHAYMYKNSNIREYANSNRSQHVQKLISTKYCTCQI